MPQTQTVPSPAVTGTEQQPIRCVIMRGGTSKGLFLRAQDVPPPGEDRDRVLRRLMGSPDILQIDGLGGARAVTSKVAIIAASERADADIDYTFAQVDIEGDTVGYLGNCGNISSGVGPFAVDEGLVAAVEPVTTVRIYNTNTDKLLIAKVPVHRGRARVIGDAAIAGVPGTGAPIVMDYCATVGAVSGKLLPTGNVVDRMTLEDGRSFDATLCDVANPCVIIAADDLGLTADEAPDAITADRDLMATIGEIHSRSGELFGIWPDWRQVPNPGFPLVILIGPAASYADTTGHAHAAGSMDLRARLVFAGKCHDSMAGTGATCLSAASRIPGSVANRMLAQPHDLPDTLRIGHPLGVMDVFVEVDGTAPGDGVSFANLGFVRTARRLIEGTALLPAGTLPAAPATSAALSAAPPVTAAIVIKDGVEVARHGDVARPTYIHSVRKSLMSALIGIAVDAGQLTLETTIGELGIDDHPALTDSEKSATIGDLLTCRSGVYLPVEPHPLVPPRPARGSVVPGSVWNYNNWDFNALGSAYERATGKSIYLAFDRLIARPLGFEDWDPYEHSDYSYEPDPLGANLTFPTYRFRLSARDLARFGQLYAQGGRWQGRQLISSAWIAQSTRRQVPTTFGVPIMSHYGYLWWLAGDDDPAVPGDAYTAWGLAGTFVTVIPSRGTVVVAVTDPDNPPTPPAPDAEPALIHFAPPDYAAFLGRVLAGPV